MTKLTDNLYAVEVPEDAINFYVSENGLSAWNNGLIMYSSILSGNWSIIGTVTKDSIDFDYQYHILGTYNFRNPDGTFRSLLTSKGLTDYHKLVIIKSK